MSIKYELSLWRDYPGSAGIREEKIATLAATGMDFAGRAQNIKLRREYTGKVTLEFEVPVKYVDPFSGDFVRNPLCSQIVEKSKIKLWRNELWYNPFGGEAVYNDKTECTEYEGAWVRGRWYDLVVDSHREKRSKKQLFYSYTCNSLFISELSRNGYSLQFVPDGDAMSVNGMGTAHDLAKRIVDGTNWEYVKTEVFPDYKEEFNAITGETVKMPVSTDRIEFSKGLDRYCLCYELYVEGNDNVDTEKKQSTITAAIENQVKDYGIESYISLDNYGFSEGKFWWKSPTEKRNKEYVLGHIKTDISVNSADSIISMDCGNMRYYTKDISGEMTNENSNLSGATSISQVAHLWEAVEGTLEYESSYNEEATEHISYLKLSAGGKMLYKQTQGKSLEQGALYCIKIQTKTLNGSVRFKLIDSSTKEEVAEYSIQSGYGGRNAYADTYWFTVPRYIECPYFQIETDNEITIEAIYLYELKGRTKQINEKFLELRSKTSELYGTIASLLQNYGWEGDNSAAIQANIDPEELSENTVYVPIWLGFGKTTVEGYQKETNTYLIEYYINGKYYQIYLPINNNKDVTVTKISSYNADKRRTIKGEKSNRFSLIETVSKTFNCFTRFIVEHDEQGRIKYDNGKPIKKFTFVSELGRKNFHGFNYGVNLESVERMIDANNLVTKCHVESLSNEYTDSNMVTIQQSKYNKLGMTYIYNFSYYINRGILNKEKFLKDYQNLVDDLHRLTQANLTKMEQDAPLLAQKTYLETDISTYELMLESYKTIAQQSLSTIGWERFINGGKYPVAHTGTDPVTKVPYSFTTDDEFLGHIKDWDADPSPYTFPNIDITKMWHYTGSSDNIALFYYDESATGGVVQGEQEGKYSVPNGFTDVDQLAQYMAYNIVGCVLGADESGTAFWAGHPRWYPTSDEEYWGRGLPKDDIKNELDKIFKTQQNYKETQAKLDNARMELESLKTQVDEYNAVLEANNKEIQRKVTSFERKYADYITEGQWKGSDYIDADTYYLDATRAMSVSCMPKVSYTIGAVDLSRLASPYDPEDKNWGRDFSYDVGDTTYIKDEELFGNTEQLTMIASITTHVDLNKQDEIEMRNYETRFEELFQQVAAAVTSVQFNENIWGKAAGFTADGGIDETILQNAFSNNKNLVITSANNTVTQDNKGISVKDNDTGKLLRLIGGGLFLSSDGGITYKAGVTPEGINASMITTGQLDTSKIVVRSGETPNFELTDQGLTAYSSIADSRITRFDQFGIYSSDKAEKFAKNWWKLPTLGMEPEEYIIANSIFSLTRHGLDLKYEKEYEKEYEKCRLVFGTIGDNKYGLLITKQSGDKIIETVRIDNKGDAMFSGTIEAKHGHVGGWTIGENALFFGDDYSTSFAGLAFAELTEGTIFWAGYKDGEYKFRVDGEGLLHANGGYIGSWEITDDGNIKGTHGNTSLMLNCNGANNTFLAAYDGSIWPFWIGLDGVLHATGADIEGTITASRGKIGSWDITDDGNIRGTYNNTSLYLNCNGADSAFLAARNGNTWPFWIGLNGVLHATGAVIGGTINAGSILSDGVCFGNSGLSAIYDYESGEGVTGTRWDCQDINGKIFARFYMSQSLFGHGKAYLCAWNAEGSGAGAGVYFEGNGNVSIYGKWKDAIPTTSDINKKNSITPIADKYGIFFDNLRPITYKYNHGTSNRLHTGFIAQEVQEALDIAAINSQDFAGLVILNRGKEDEAWALRYEEFIALNTSEIQKLKARVAELEAKVASLTSI